MWSKSLYGAIQREPLQMHVDLFKLLPQATGQQGLRLAVAAPRSHAKSPIDRQASVLWC